MTSKNLCTMMGLTGHPRVQTSNCMWKERSCVWQCVSVCVILYGFLWYGVSGVRWVRYWPNVHLSTHTSFFTQPRIFQTWHFSDLNYFQIVRQRWLWSWRIDEPEFHQWQCDVHWQTKRLQHEHPEKGEQLQVADRRDHPAVKKAAKKTFRVNFSF